MDIAALVTLLKSIDGVRAETNESKLNLPGVWVRPINLRRDVISGEWTQVVQLRLLVDDADADRARIALLDLFAKVTTEVDPDGEPTFGTVTRPSTGAPVPALIFPLDLLP